MKIFLIVLVALIGLLLLMLLLAGNYLCSFSMGVKRQTLEAARKWQEDHYDISWYDPLEKTDYTVESYDGYVLHAQFLKNPVPSEKYVIITHGYNPHPLIGLHKRFYKTIFIGTHVLGLVYHQHRLAYLTAFHQSVFYHPGGLFHHIVHLFKITDTSQQVEAVGMEGLDIDIMGGISHHVEQALLKLGGGCSGEGEHKELFVLHILEHEQRG